MIRVYVSVENPDQRMLCDDCAIHSQSDWWPTKQFVPPGADCDACSASQEAAGPSPTTPPTGEPA